jgi:hypothetical protein
VKPRVSLLLAVLILFVLISLWVGSVPVFDDFIGFQYAHHLAAGDGLTLDPGTGPSGGYSGLLWVLICAALDAAGMSAPAIAPFLSLTMGLLSLVMLWVLLRRRAETTIDWLVPLVGVATAAPFVVASFANADTALFGALILGGVLALDQVERQDSPGRLATVALVTLATILCRPEGTVVAALVALALFRSLPHDDGPLSARRRIAIGAIAVGAVVFHAWRVVEFHSFIPESIRLDLGMNVALWRPLQPFEAEPYGFYYATVALLSWFAWTRSPRDPADRHALITCVSLGVLYLFLRDGAPTQLRYAALMGPVALPWPHLVRTVRASLADPAPRRVVVVLVLAAAGFIAFGAVVDQRVTVARYVQSQELSLRPLGEWIRDYHPGARIATDMPGVVPYYAGASVVDLRDGSRDLRTVGDPNRLIVSTRPDIILLGADGIFDRRVSPHLAPVVPLLPRAYKFLAALRTAWPRDRTVLIYHRLDLPPVTEEQHAAFPRGLGNVLLFNP